MSTSVVWSQLNDLQKIDLANKNLDELPFGISECERVEFVNLERNSLENLPNDLEHLACLKVLNLNQNAFRCLPRSVFKLDTLVELSARDNQLEAIHPDVGNLCDLTHLDISHNKLTKLTAGVGFLNRLKHVNLSNNQLLSIPHELTAVCGLVKLDISNNKIKKLPCVQNLLHLKVLKAKSNSLKRLPDFSQCRELVCVDFSHNLIEEIDSACLNCQPFLKEVYLQNNKIKSLPEDFSNLSSLQVLDVSSNKLNTLPSNIVDFPTLQTLRIANNPFKDIPLHYAKADTVRLMAFLRERPPIEPESEDSSHTPQHTITTHTQTHHDMPVARFSLGQLRRCGSLVHTTDDDVPDTVWDNAVSARVVVVNLSHCKRALSHRVVELADTLLELHLVDAGLTELSACVGQLRELQVLILDQNLLTDLPTQLASCKYMKDLSLFCNRLSEVPSVVYELRLLRTLTLSNNRLVGLETAWSGLEGLRHLETLDLSNNEILHLPPQLGLFTSLKCLKVTGNKFRQPSYQVLCKGTESVLAYLRNKLPETPSDPTDQPSDKKRPASIAYFIS